MDLATLRTSAPRRYEQAYLMLAGLFLGALVIWPAVDGNGQTTPLDAEAWQGLVIGPYFFKIAIALVDTPFFYLGTSVLQRWIAAGPEHPPAGVLAVPDGD